MIPFIIKTTGITNWNLIIVTTSGRWINFFSNHKTETPVMKKTAYNTGAASPRPRFALIHDEL